MGLKKNDIFDAPLVQDVVRSMDGEHGMQVPVPDEFVESPLMRVLLKTDNLDAASAAALLAVDMTAGQPDPKLYMPLVPAAIRAEVLCFRSQPDAEVGQLFKGLCDLDTPTATRLALAALTHWGDALHTALTEGALSSAQTEFIGDAALSTCKLLDRLTTNDNWQRMPKEAVDAFVEAAQSISGFDPRHDRQRWAWDIIETLQKKRGVIAPDIEETPAPEETAEQPAETPPPAPKKLSGGSFDL